VADISVSITPPSVGLFAAGYETQPALESAAYRTCDAVTGANIIHNDGPHRVERMPPPLVTCRW
jgi:hypothetical protein